MPDRNGLNQSIYFMSSCLMVKKTEEEKHIGQKYKIDLFFCISRPVNVNENSHESVLCLIKNNYSHSSMGPQRPPVTCETDTIHGAELKMTN